MILGGSYCPNLGSREFNDFIDSHELVVLNTWGCHFTWSNKRLKGLGL